MTAIKIVGLGGASNRHSNTDAALQLAVAGARAAGAEVSVFDLYALDLPMYRYGVEDPAVAPFIAATRAAHGMLWCTPLYHGSMAGAFKNALDWLQLLADDTPPYLSGKVVGLIATAGGEQALQAINSMEFTVRSLRGWTLPLTAPILYASRVFSADGQCLDNGVAERLQLLGTEVVRAASKLHAPAV